MVKSIVVISGKGGVGKTLTASTIINILRGKKYKVAAIDADTDNPHLADFLNIKGKIDIIPDGDSRKLVPVTEKNVSVFSSSLIAEDSPIGMLGTTSGQLVSDVIEFGEWGDADYMVIDLPAGAGDEMRAAFEAVQDTLVGCVLVVQPAHLRAAERIIRLLLLNEIPIIGVIENMAYYETRPEPRCSKCKKMISTTATECKSCKTPVVNVKNYLFGEPGADKLCQKHGLKFLGTIPIVKLNIENGGRILPKEFTKPVEDAVEISIKSAITTPGFIERVKGKVKEVTTAVVAPMLVDLWKYMNNQLDVGGLQKQYSYSGKRLVKMVLLDDKSKAVAVEHFRVNEGKVEWLRITKDNKESIRQELEQSGVTIRAKARALAAAFKGELKLSNGSTIKYTLRTAVLNGDIIPEGQRGDMIQTLGFLSGVYEHMQRNQPSFMKDFVSRLL